MAARIAHYEQDDDMWSALPRELLELIFKQLDGILFDCIRFGAVCKGWRTTMLENLVLPHPSVPLLLVPIGEDDVVSIRELLDVTTNKFYKIPPVLQAHDKIIVGSSGHWLVTMACSSPGIHEMELFNPVTRAYISLPPATMFDEFANCVDRDLPLKYFIEKAMVFSNPNSESIVMAIHGFRGHLAFCRIGDNKWTKFLDTEYFSQTEDVMCHKGRFYAVTQNAIVLACDLNPLPKMTEIARLPKRAIQKKYLLESSDGLLMVTRYMEPGDIKRTAKFTIDGLDVSSGTWMEVKSLDDQIMFLGTSCSISFRASELSGFKSNCIYFVDDWSDMYLDGGCSDMGIYDWEDNKISTFYNPTGQFLPWPMFWLTNKHVVLPSVVGTIQ